MVSYHTENIPAKFEQNPQSSFREKAQKSIFSHFDGRQYAKSREWKKILMCGLLQMVSYHTENILAKFEQNPQSGFQEKAEKPPKIAGFRNFLENRNFFGKSGRVTFEPLSIANFM